MSFKSLILVLLLSLDSSARVRIGYNKRYTSANKAVKEIKKKLGNGKSSPGVLFQAVTFDSDLLTKFINLQFEAVILPLSEFRKIYHSKSIHDSNEAVILPIPLSLESGFFSKASCAIDQSLENVKKVYLTKDSPESFWLQLHPRKGLEVRELGFFEVLEKVNHPDMSCQDIVWGTVGHTYFVKNKGVLFRPLGSVPLWLFVNARSLSFQKEVYANISNVLSFLQKEQFHEHMGHESGTNLEGLKRLVIDYNFAGQKFDESKLDEIIKIY